MELFLGGDQFKDQHVEIVNYLECFFDKFYWKETRWFIEVNADVGTIDSRNDKREWQLDKKFKKSNAILFVRNRYSKVIIASVKSDTSG